LSLFFKQRCTNDLKLDRMDQYIAYCNIIAILKIMQYNNCSSTLLQYCNNIELLPSPSNQIVNTSSIGTFSCSLVTHYM